uniref:transcription factor GTE3, chloroplastic-like n=1 Tax=Erigeron canadensis TaxID=72917 RepID=UPI001CB9634E|nr:transcription factor GTE3, chloroplastic-like [Erigeron canadensis]
MGSEKNFSKKSFKNVNSNKSNKKLSQNLGMGSKGNLGVKFGFKKQENRVTIELTSRSRHEMKQIKRKLVNELELVRRLVKKIEGGSNRDLSVSGLDRKTMNKKMKSSGGGGGGGGGGGSGVDARFSNKLFKSCGALLEKLMKHKHSWVFNTPVDPLALGLHDYFDIVKHPMDLGTVKSRLEKNWYNSPMEFAEDVRLTFQNAMTYNPKGQDVYAMAEFLLKLFEEKWKVLEADYVKESRVNEVSLPTGTRKQAPSQFLPVSDRMETPVPAVDHRPQATKVSKLGKSPSLKKPRAKDLNKREMTYEEKQKLSVDLQNLPCEKLDHVVLIIKKRNPTLSQKDDEIEVDIDTFDTETLWELDRFVTNYKKGLNKNKRKAEFPDQEKMDAESEVPNRERIEVESEFHEQEKMEAEPEVPNRERIEVDPEVPNQERVELESKFPDHERIEVDSEVPNQERLEPELHDQEIMEVEPGLPDQERIELDPGFPDQERMEVEPRLPDQEKTELEPGFPVEERIEVEAEPEVLNQERVEVESEFPNQDMIEIEANIRDKNPELVVVDAPKEVETDERVSTSQIPIEELVDDQVDHGDKSSSSSSSSSVSGSSSSDSDSDSSSEAGSDAGHSSKA